MNNVLRLLTACFLCVSLLPANAQPDKTSRHDGSGLPQPDSDLRNRNWKASWIAVPGTVPNGYGVYLFRKTVAFESKPASMAVHVSADNRYKLYVNDSLVSLGPARGDLQYWNYETIDIAPFLKSGDNLIAALVWNDAEWRPEAQMTVRTGFILQGADAPLNTDATWKGAQDSSYQPLPVRLQAYYAAGCSELVDMNRHIAGWRNAGFDDSRWKNAATLSKGVPNEIFGPFGIGNGWGLTPSMLPQMEQTIQRIPVIRQTTGISMPGNFPGKADVVTIPPHSVATLLLDQTFLTNAYPTLQFSKGRNARISLTYAESLFAGSDKGNRNEVEGKTLVGRMDSIISGGGNHQEFTTLYFRTFRYLQIRVTTEDEPLQLEDIFGRFTGYPFTNNTKFDAGDSILNKMLDIGWRTARLCATETYNDCPYYEQLQYIGDGRIQALVSLYNSGDDRLVRNAINLMDHSRLSNGLTESRHPSFSPQFIPTFSLWYIGMLHDYWMYGKDSVFLKDKLAGARMVLDFFRGYQQADGSLKGVPHWMFTDWVSAKDWHEGIGPAGGDGFSAMIDLQLLWAYELAAEMEKKSGMPSYGIQYEKAAVLLKQTIRKKYWDAGKQLFADRTAKDVFSQHSNALAILTGITTPAETKTIARKLLTDSSLAPASIYFKFYTNLALVKAGLGNEYLDWLGAWKENIDLGLTTWAEMADIRHSRSDCHAWGSSPNIEFFRILLGIDSDAPGFTKVKIEPHPGKLRHLKGEMPHPQGVIRAEYTSSGNTWTARIELPGKLSGRFVWKGKSLPLHAGVNEFRL